MNRSELTCAALRQLHVNSEFILWLEYFYKQDAKDYKKIINGVYKVFYYRSIFCCDVSRSKWSKIKDLKWASLGALEKICHRSWLYINIERDLAHQLTYLGNVPEE